jgi:hypothetical protein
VVSNKGVNMIKIIPLTKERIKKFNLLGCDMSIGFAKYASEYQNVYDGSRMYEEYIEPVNYLYDNEEIDGIITHRVILWRVKIEVKTVVEYDFKLA